MAQPHSPISQFATELLEHTLRYLDSQDLLNSMRVCQQWAALIFRSRSLQKRLCLFPEDRFVRYVCTEFEDSRRVIGKSFERLDLQAHQVLSPVQNGLHVPVKIHAHQPSITSWTVVRGIGRLNALFLRDERPPSNVWDKLLWKGYTAFRSSRPITKATPLRYRGMLLSQPPVHEVQYYLCLIPPRNINYRFRPRPNDAFTNLGEHRGTIQKVTGVTVQDLVDKVAELEDRSGVIVDWRCSYFHGTHLFSPSSQQERQMIMEAGGAKVNFDLEEYMRQSEGGQP